MALKLDPCGCKIWDTPEVIPVVQMTHGWSFPNALLQHAIGDLEGISINMAELQARRDRLVTALRHVGYDAREPEGTFYIIARSPLADDYGLCRAAYRI